jgi:cell division protein FtsQ
VTPRNRRLEPSERAADTVDVLDVAPSDSSPSEAPKATRAPSTRLADGLQAVLGAGLVLALSTGVAWGARRHVLTSPRFAVEEIVVRGAHQRTAEALATEAGVSKGSNVFALDLDRARGKLLADPWVETATLTRQLPGTIVVQVTEREIGAIVALPEPYLAGRDGRIFKRLEVGDPTDLPVVTGITTSAVADDREGVQRTLVRALDLAAEYDHGPMAARAPLQEIHVSNGGELTLLVGKEAVSLALGLPPFRRKLEEAARILGELERKNTHASVVMLDDEARPDRVVVRTR